MQIFHDRHFPLAIVFFKCYQTNIINYLHGLSKFDLQPQPKHKVLALLYGIGNYKYHKI